MEVKLHTNQLSTVQMEASFERKCYNYRWQNPILKPKLCSTNTTAKENGLKLASPEEHQQLYFEQIGKTKESASCN